jgi:protein pelota
MTVVKTKIEINIPRKRRGHCEQHDKALIRFYDAIMQGILRHIRFDVVKCVLVASPGFVKEQCCEYIFAQAVKTDNRLLIENKLKFLQVHSSSGYKHSIKEVLSDPAVAIKLADTKAAAEIRALDAFYAMLQSEPNRAFYGVKHVEAASKQNAIEILLITDELFR